MRSVDMVNEVKRLREALPGLAAAADAAEREAGDGILGADEGSADTLTLAVTKARLRCDAAKRRVGELEAELPAVVGQELDAEVRAAEQALADARPELQRIQAAVGRGVRELVESVRCLGAGDIPAVGQQALSVLLPLWIPPLPSPLNGPQANLAAIAADPEHPGHAAATAFLAHKPKVKRSDIDHAGLRAALAEAQRLAGVWRDRPGGHYGREQEVGRRVVALLK